MSFEHKNIFPQYDPHFHVKYCPVVSGETLEEFKMLGHSNNAELEEEIFYLRFEDCKSADDKEGFLLMCSENELAELVNHLRMLRGV